MGEAAELTVPSVMAPSAASIRRYVTSLCISSSSTGSRRPPSGSSSIDTTTVEPPTRVRVPRTASAAEAPAGRSPTAAPGDSRVGGSGRAPVGLSADTPPLELTRIDRGRRVQVLQPFLFPLQRQAVPDILQVHAGHVHAVGRGCGRDSAAHA
eukprot:scaffold9935_cov122-Isochrysis_galbana.AAC.2